MNRSSRILLTGLWAVASACGSVTAPDSGDTVEIVLAVTGGLAGVDWQFTVDGRQGRIIGDRCEPQINCNWEPGEVLATFDGVDLSGLASKFFERGFFDGPADHGTECCDQFAYRLTYADSNNRRSVVGSDGTIPPNVRSLILLVEQFVSNARF